MGRNRVVQLGSGSDSSGPAGKADAASGRRSGEIIDERHLLSEAPLSVCIEKLRGFVADHHADVESAESLARVREWKRAQKAKGKGKSE